MKYLYSILFFITILPLSAAQYVTERDSSIHVVRGNLQRLQDELIISFDLSVNRELTANENVILEPIITGDLGEMNVLPKIYINSRRQQVMYKRGFYNDSDLSKTLQRKNGTQQNFHYLASLPYADWMKTAKLVVNEESCGCGLPIANNLAFTADVTTPINLPAELPMLASIMPEEVDVKIRNEQGSALVIFPLNKTVVYPDFKDNLKELNKITNSIDIVKQDPNCTVTNIYIHGYASPEGPYKLNEKLAKGRTSAVKDYVNNIYHFSPKIFTIESTPEDWVGFEALLEHSSYVNKNEILKIVRSDIAPDKKEQAIRTKYPQFFKMLLDDWFIMLRHTDYIIEYEVCFFNTVALIEEIYNTNPKNLSLNELFQLAQSYRNGSPNQDDVFMKSVALYPEDPIANLNAAGVALRRRDITSAKYYLDLSYECGEKDLALGVYHLLLEEYEDAGYYFDKVDEENIPESNQYIILYQSIINSI
ncbi:MAG: DUF3868 domain-containing protein [Rikenellaceae bacterium]